MRALLLLILLAAIGFAFLPKPTAPAPVVQVPKTQTSEPQQPSSNWTHDPRAAANWATRVDDPQEREAAVAEVAIAWADHDPEAAAQFLVSHTQPGQTQRNAAIGILQRMAAKDLARATAWAATFPEDVRERAFEQIDRARSHASARPLELDPLPGDP